MIRRARALAALVTLAGLCGHAQADAFARVRFLIGDWIAVDTPPGETGSFSFKLSVQDHVMIRTNEANYAATADRAASRHDDLLVMYVENGSLKADYFDSEGHVIRYAVRPDDADAVTLISEARPSEPRYRLTYRAGANGLLNGTFEIASPDAPSAFKPYLSWSARKK